MKPTRYAPLQASAVCGSNEHCAKMSMMGREESFGSVECKTAIIVFGNHGGCPFCFSEKMERLNKEWKNLTWREIKHTMFPRIVKGRYVEGRAS